MGVRQIRELTLKVSEDAIGQLPRGGNLEMDLPWLVRYAARVSRSIRGVEFH
jgi:hypothetical protein